MNLFEHPSAAVFFVGFVVYIAIRGRFEQLTKGREVLKRRVDAAEKGLLALVGVGCGLLPLVYLFTPLLDFADVELPDWMPWVGGVALFAGLRLFHRSHADLGTNWSVTLELKADHVLVRHGVYARIRHPMYSAIFLVCIAQGLLLPNLLAGWAGLVTFALLYEVRVPKEEVLMHDAFGQEYTEFCSTRGRILPGRGDAQVSGRRAT